jgi:hypothetical protein
MKSVYANNGANAGCADALLANLIPTKQEEYLNSLAHLSIRVYVTEETKILYLIQARKI